MVKVRCDECGRDSEMRWSDLIRTASRSDAGKVRKPNGSCGCQSKACFNDYIDRNIDRISIETQLRIWADSQGESNILTVAGKHHTNKYATGKIVRRIELMLRELTDQAQWFRECSEKRRELEAHWEGDKDDWKYQWEEHWEAEPVKLSEEEEKQKERRKLFNRRYDRCFSLAEMHMERGRLWGTCSELIRQAEEMLSKWGFLLRFKDPKFREALTLRGIPALEFLELANWIRHTKRGTISTRRFYQRLAIAKAKLKHKESWLESLASAPGFQLKPSES